MKCGIRIMIYHKYSVRVQNSLAICNAYGMAKVLRNQWIIQHKRIKSERTHIKLLLFISGKHTMFIMSN